MSLWPFSKKKPKYNPDDPRFVSFRRELKDLPSKLTGSDAPKKNHAQARPSNKRDMEAVNEIKDINAGVCIKPTPFLKISPFSIKCLFHIMASL